MKYIQPLTVLLSFMLVFPSNANATSLKDAIKFAIETNPRIDAARASQRATEFVYKQAQGRFLPELDLNADIGKEKIDRPLGIGPLVNDRWRRRKQVTLTVRQVLFDGWDRANDLYRSQARISSASFKVIARSEILGLNVVESYIDVVRHISLINLARKNVSRHKSLLSLIRQRFEGGKAPIGDVEQTVERLEAAKSLVAQISIALETANAKYKNAVGVSPKNLRAVGNAPGLPYSVKEAIQSALSNNPRIQSAGAEIDIANFDKKQFRSSLFPQLSLQGDASYGENLGGTPGRNDELRAMVVLTWKLYDGGIRRNRELELAERHSEKMAEQKILARQIVQEVEISWARNSHGRSQVSALKKQVRQNGRVLSSYQNEYDANKRSLLDLLDAENSSFGSKFALSNAKALYQYSGYQILAQSGNLLSKLGISTPNDVQIISAPSSYKGLSNIGKLDFSIPSLND